MSELGKELVRELCIVNSQGLHTRPVMKFVDVVAGFGAEVRVDKGEGTEQVDGRSPMEMMLLEAPQGTSLRIIARGTDAAELLDALEELVNSRFGEE
ncbi:MAG: HPr family phosphocarrier protein [bacterium]|nr:HPr family phosphocarrier protein [bacterium]